MRRPRVYRKAMDSIPWWKFNGYIGNIVVSNEAVYAVIFTMNTKIMITGITPTICRRIPGKRNEMQCRATLLGDLVNDVINTIER